MGVVRVELEQHVFELSPRHRLAQRGEDRPNPFARFLAGNLQLGRDAVDELVAGQRHPRVVGDAVWDLLAARRAHMLSIGLLSGGYGEDELIRAGAFRVYRDPAELREALDEIRIVP